MALFSDKYFSVYLMYSSTLLPIYLKNNACNTAPELRRQFNKFLESTRIQISVKSTRKQTHKDLSQKLHPNTPDTEYSQKLHFCYNLEVTLHHITAKTQNLRRIGKQPPEVLEISQYSPRKTHVSEYLFLIKLQVSDLQLY